MRRHRAEPPWANCTYHLKSFTYGASPRSVASVVHACCIDATVYGSATWAQATMTAPRDGARPFAASGLHTDLVG